MTDGVAGLLRSASRQTRLCSVFTAWSREGQSWQNGPVGDAGAIQDDVDFNFDGALEACREAWKLATTVEDRLSDRRVAAGIARREWRGPFADEFVDRCNDEAASVADLTGDLRVFSRGLAAKWADAMNEQARRLRARETQRRRDSQNVVEKVINWARGEELEEAPAPAHITPPQPPAFEPTGQLPTY